MINDHGSPPGLRVTAGGRIVPSNFLPLGSPRYLQHHQQLQEDVTYNPPTRNFQQFSIPNGSVTYNFRGQICQWIDGNLLPLQQGPQGPILLMDSPNYPLQCLPGISVGNAMGPQLALPQMYPPPNGTLPLGPTVDAHMPFTDTHIQNLRNQYATLEREKLEHEREEVRIKNTLSSHARTQMIDRKRHLTITLDHLRKQIKLLEANQLGEHGHVADPNMVALYGQTGHVPPAGYAATMPDMYGPQPAFLSPPTGYPAYNNENVPENNGITNSFSEPTLSAVPSAEDVGQVYTCHQPAAYVSDFNANAFALDGHPRNSQPHLHGRNRSHAIEIRDPRNNGQGTEMQSSTLDPTSPVYKPGKPITLEVDNVQSPSPLASAEGLQLQTGGTSTSFVIQQSKEDNEDTGQGLEYSTSSATTTDFFPTNSHEHSFSKFIARKVSSGEEQPANKTGDSNPFPTTPNSVGCSYGTTLPNPNSPFELAHPKTPQPSPVDDYRMSSFVRDINPITELPSRRADNRVSSAFTKIAPSSKYSPSTSSKNCQPGDLNEHILLKHSNHSSQLSHQTLPDPSCETQRNREYMEGYVVGITGQAPGLDRSQSFRKGFMDGFRNQVDFHQGTNCNTSNVSLKSEHLSPSQLPNTAAPSFHDLVDIRSNSHMDAMDASIMTLPQQADENIRFINRSMASYTPTKENDRDSSSQRRTQFSYLLPVSSSEQRVFCSTRNGNQQVRSLDRDSDGSIETSLPITTPKSDDQAATKAIAPSPTKRSNNYSSAVAIGSRWRYTSKGISTTEEVEKLKGEITPKMRTRTNRNGSMDGAVDGLAEATVSESPAKVNISSTATRTPHLKPSVSPPESVTKGCSPKCFSPSKRLHSFLHGGSRMDKEKENKGVRSPSPDPARMTPAEKYERKQKWANRFRDLKHKEEAEINEYKAKNPLPDKVN
jgi:hypothetical protein